MKKLKLENYGVHELNYQESRMIEGGNPYWAFLVGYVIVEAALNPRAHAKAFMDGYNSI